MHGRQGGRLGIRALFHARIDVEVGEKDPLGSESRRSRFVAREQSEAETHEERGRALP